MKTTARLGGMCRCRGASLFSFNQRRGLCGAAGLRVNANENRSQLAASATLFHYGIHQSWADWTESIATVPGRDDLWLETVEALGPRGGRGPALHSKSARVGNQLLRHRRHVFGGEERRGTGPRAEGFWAWPRAAGYRYEGLHADER